MDDIESLRAKLADRDERLNRAWRALELIQAVLQKRTSPGAFQPETRSFEALARLLADGIEEELAKRDAKFLHIVASGRRAYTWVGRAPKNEKESAEMQTIKKTLDLALMGLVENQPYESFYISQNQVPTSPENQSGQNE